MEKLKINSNLKNITIIERFVEEISEKYHLQDTHYGNILVCLTEAFCNAVIHGNENDPEKFVTVHFDPLQRGISFKISDEGKGFDPDKVGNPITDDPEKGRGLFLIQTLSDEVNISDHGRCIEMVFDIEGIGQKTMDQRKNLFNQYYNKIKHKA
ncbi:MAG: ATP-binding protein [Bacteroidetes bacterium]|nr:ATP-binding protein [Bacteroidota bacterium]